MFYKPKNYKYEMNLNDFKLLFVALRNACLALLSIQLQITIYTINWKKKKKMLIYESPCSSYIVYG